MYVLMTKLEGIIIKWYMYHISGQTNQNKGYISAGSTR